MNLRRKPKLFDAVVYDGTNGGEVEKFAGRHGFMVDRDDRGMSLHTSQGTVYAVKHCGLIASETDQITVLTPTQLAEEYEEVDD